MEKINNLEQRASGKIVYRFSTPFDPKANTLYINVIPEYSCINSCLFCGRDDAIQQKPNIYEKKAGTNLYLRKTPSIEEVVKAVEKEWNLGFFNRTKEIAFVGLGEPLLQFDLVKKSMRAIRSLGYKRKLRIDTNGLIRNWYHFVQFGCFEKHYLSPARELKKAGLNEIRISVNATNAFEYYDLCRPSCKPIGYKRRPFSSEKQVIFNRMIRFTKECIAEGIITRPSFVIGFDNWDVKTRSKKDYTKFAKEVLGIKKRNIIFREYVKPI